MRPICFFTILPKSCSRKIRAGRAPHPFEGVGVYFVSQNPLDIPDVVLGQLGNRVQHALRAFTPRDQKAVQAAAQTFRQNPKLKVEEVLTELAVGEALVSMLDRKGKPTVVERAKIVPPRSQLGQSRPAAQAALSNHQSSQDTMRSRSIGNQRMREVASADGAKNVAGVEHLPGLPGTAEAG